MKIEQVSSSGLYAQGDEYGMLSVREKPAGGLLWSSHGHSKAITTLAWSHDGRYLVSGSADTTIKVWDAATGAVLQTYTGHSAEVRALAWSPEDNKIVSSAGHEDPQLWTPHLF